MAKIFRSTVHDWSCILVAFINKLIYLKATTADILKRLKLIEDEKCSERITQLEEYRGIDQIRIQFLDEEVCYIHVVIIIWPVIIPFVARVHVCRSRS